MILCSNYTMKNQIIIICICIFCLGCLRGEKIESIKYIATVNNHPIFFEEVDSTISKQVYQLRRTALKNILRSKIFEIEAQKLKISKDELQKRKIDIHNKVSLAQYHSYINQLDIDSKSIDTTKIIEYLISLNKEKYFEHYADSLLAETDITINLKATKYNEVNLDDLAYHELSNGRKIIVYIISDYNCKGCQNAEKRLRRIIDRYEQFVSFRFVYFSEYIDKKALVAEAAANQDKFIGMHEILFDNPDLNGGDPAILEFAKKIGLNMKMLEEDIFNPKTLKSLIINKEKIIKHNIYVTPSFVVNNNLINDEFALYTLEKLINEELENKN